MDFVRCWEKQLCAALAWWCLSSVHCAGCWTGICFNNLSIPFSVDPPLPPPSLLLLLAATGTKCSCTGLGGANHRQSYLYWARGGCCLPSNTGQRGRGAVYMQKQRGRGKGGGGGWGVACEPWPTSSCQRASADRSKSWHCRKLLFPPLHIPAGALSVRWKLCVITHLQLRR